MCCIVRKPKGVAMPAENIIQYLSFRNPDGFGYVTGDGKSYRSTDYEDFRSHLAQDAREDEELLIHFRYATHGSNKDSNCHPFYDAKHNVYFMHNGVLPIRTTRDMTDSETMLRNVFVPAADKYGYGSFAFWHIVRENAYGCRYAFLDANSGNVQLIGRYYEFEGCFYSNPSGLI